MVHIRKIKIENFRGVQALEWMPSSGVNCLIGPGDSGKSTLLDAIDWCLGSKRSLPVTDADFYRLNVDSPICIDITIGDLNDSLKSLEVYASYLRGFNTDDGGIEDEPGDGLETVLTIRLSIADDLDPRWMLVSERAEAQGLSRNLAWSDRVQIAPTRIGSFAAHHLTWQKGSILTRLADERADTKAALAAAAREARASFGDSAGQTLEETLAIIQDTADRLGVSGGEITAMLDAHSVSFSGGAISLHDGQGVSLRKLGLGSSRLLVAGLQNKIASEASIVLVDEVEHGLEPHRIARLLIALGAKDNSRPLQVFMTTHSPVVLRELATTQLHVMRRSDEHEILAVQGTDAAQGSLRRSAEAYLGARVLVCEGATEVGLIRGIDLYRDDQGLPTFMAAGGVTVDAGGVNKVYRSAQAFLDLGYETATLRDDDKQPDEEEEGGFEDGGGAVFRWSDNHALEDEIFACIPERAAQELYRYAESIHGADLVRDHLRTACGSSIDPEKWLTNLDDDKPLMLADAAKKGGWFKRVSIMEDAARTIIGPALADSHPDLKNVIGAILVWAEVDGD